jgi:hypothetical protein
MSETTANPTTDTQTELKMAGVGGLHAFLTLLKYIIYGWAARILLALWVGAAFVVGVLASIPTHWAVGALVGILTFVGIGLAYGFYELRKDE